MKAKDLTLLDLITLPEKDGGGFLNEHRMIISSAVAWGLLGRDLIVALGIERAKRFLMRYGWNCGLHEAEVFKDLFPWENELDWIFAGQQMHSLSGRVRSVLESSTIDKPAGIFNVEGYWYDSYEGKQYLNNFPVHHESVCFFLAGYASGYCSAIMGKKVMFKEVECIGKGDLHCKYVGKTVEEWEQQHHDHNDPMMNYEQADLANELDRAYKRIEAQREVEKRVSAISQNLTKIILQGKGFEALVTTLGKSLACGVIIENQHFNRMAAYGETPTVSLKTLLAHDKKRDHVNQHAKPTKLLKELNTAQFQVRDAESSVQYRLVTPIMLRRQLFGYISLINNREPFGDLEQVLLEQASNACAIQVLNEQTALETEQRLIGQLLDELLTKPFQESMDLTRYAYLGYDINQPHYVMVVKLKSKQASSVDHEVLSDGTHKIIQFLTTQLKQHGLTVLLSTKLDQVAVLIPDAYLGINQMKIKAYGKQLVTQLKHVTDNLHITLGISSLCEDVEKIHYGYKEANKSLEIAALKKEQSSVVFASELGFLSIMLDARKPEELEKFANHVLGPIKQYDLKHSTELLKTIYYYLENECNLYRTSRALHISISGMRYRLHRMKEVFNIEFGESSARFHLQMALEIDSVLEKWS
ncbi:XylR N-terminal domain-containing protein [Paenibacillus periandrae]|uniref:XylR N-terminal domain-containing protein n=1 Tax=Paenibacillus periandrae TaxID=1761741 RepID=UPI001F09105A